jgi:hypothetical protein
MRSLQKVAPALSVTLLSEPFSRYNRTTDLMAPGAEGNRRSHNQAS